MAEAISDTGPVLHLHEIERLDALQVFSSLEIPELVEAELLRFGLLLPRLEMTAGTRIDVARLEPGLWEPLGASFEGTGLQPADSQVAALAAMQGTAKVVLTDDMALRKALESRGSTVVGTVGILVRAYHAQRLEKAQLTHSIEKLFGESSLHAAPVFRRYVFSLIESM